MSKLWFLFKFLLMLVGYVSALISMVYAAIEKDHVRAIFFLLLLFGFDRCLDNLVGDRKYKG